MATVSERLPGALEGERVDRAVALVTGRSRREAHQAIEAGGVRLDGEVVHRAADRVAGGQHLEVELPEVVVAAVEPDPHVELGVVHADDHVVVLDKPAGLAVHRAPGVAGPSVAGGLVHRFPDLAEVGERHRPGIVHRLDAGTSGLMVAARTEGARAHLVDQLRRREVTRRYLALLWGHPEHDRGVVDAAVGRSRRDRTRFAVVHEGRPARTHFEVERHFRHPAPTALVVCRLETGRTHQIRVHMASIGHPVVGDDRYGGDRSPVVLHRPFLHARELVFVHPATGEEMRFESDLPADLEGVLAGLE